MFTDIAYIVDACACRHVVDSDLMFVPQNGSS